LVVVAEDGKEDRFDYYDDVFNEAPVAAACSKTAVRADTDGELTAPEDEEDEAEAKAAPAAGPAVPPSELRLLGCCAAAKVLAF